MAVSLISCATGNWSSTSSWSSVPTTGALDSELNNYAVTTTPGDSGTISPGAITVDGLCLRVAQISGVSGTFTATLRNTTDSVDVASCTVNVSDLAQDGATGAGSTWHCFKITPSLLDAAKSYCTRVVRSSAAGTLNLCGSNTAAANICRQYRTTDHPASAPTTGDTVRIMGELVSAGSGNNIEITLDGDNSSVSIAGVSSIPQFVIGKRGILSFSTTSAANPKVKYAGTFAVQSGSTLNIGTAVTSIPSNSTAEILINPTANVDSGILINPGATVNIYGASKTTLSTLMTADKVGTNTVIALASTSGWNNSDEIAFASTSRTPSQCEKKTISSVDSSTQVTLTAGLTNAHSGTSPTQAEVINLTRNIKIHGASSSLQGYIVVANTAVVNIQYAEFYQLGSATASKRGIDVQTTTGTFIFKYNSIHEYGVTSSIGLNVSGASGQTASTLIIQNNVGYSMPTTGNFVNLAATTGTWLIDSNTFMLTTSGNIFTLADMGGTFTNNTAVGGGSGAGMQITDTNVYGTVSGNTSHSNGTYGMILQGISASTVSTAKCYRNNNSGLQIAGTQQRSVVIDSASVFGNTGGANINMQSACDVLFTNCDANGDTTFSSTVAVALDTCANIYFESCSFGVAAGIKTTHTTGDISLGAYATVFLRNCTLGSSTEVVSWSASTNFRNAFVMSQKHDGTTGSHKFWQQYGTGSIDTGIYNNSTQSLRLTPNSASNKLESAPLGYGFKCAVASGSTVTVSVDVRKSSSSDSGGANYNGNQQRLIVKKNIAAGITSDTVLATASASTGTWETLTGTTGTVTDDCILNFVVDCDGTAGWVNVGNYSSTPILDTKKNKYWIDGLPGTVSDNGSLSRSRVQRGM